jgi:5-methylcytosine-specific restriction endonuclease McrA
MPIIGITDAERKRCDRERHRERRLEQPDLKERERKAALCRYYAHRLECNVASRSYYWKNRNRLMGDHKCWKMANPDKVKAYNEANRAKTAERSRAWALANPERVVSNRVTWLAANRERHAKTRLAWERSHLDKCRLKCEKRRALKYANTPLDEMLTSAEWLAILAQHDGHCAYCGKKTERLTLDHVIPLSKGGKHSKDNVMPACLHCNVTKGTRILEAGRTAGR